MPLLRLFLEGCFFSFLSFASLINLDGWDTSTKVGFITFRALMKAGVIVASLFGLFLAASRIATTMALQSAGNVAFSRPGRQDCFIQVFVRLPDRTNVTFSGTENSTVGDIMQYVADNTPFGLNDSHVALYSSTGPLLTDKSVPLRTLGITSGSQLEVMGGILGGMPKRKASKPSGAE